MNRSKKGKNRKAIQKKSHSNNKVRMYHRHHCAHSYSFFGVYLYCQQINIQKNNELQTDASLQIPLGKDLETPISLAPRQEQIIRHSGYTVSHNKDLKIPNWVSYELTREETRGKEKKRQSFHCRSISDRSDCHKCRLYPFRIRQRTYGSRSRYEMES